MRLTFDLRCRWWAGLMGVALLLLLLLPAFARASTASSAPTLIFPWQQVWPLVIGALVPLATYALNRVGPWVSQPVKAVVLLVVSAAATALYTALATSVLGFNDATLQLVLTGVAASLAAHHMLWKPSGVSTLLGAYGDFGIRAARGKRGAPGHPFVAVPEPSVAVAPPPPSAV